VKCKVEEELEWGSINARSALSHLLILT
jgi:hypothetical protein